MSIDIVDFLMASYSIIIIACFLVLLDELWDTQDRLDEVRDILDDLL